MNPTPKTSTNHEPPTGQREEDAGRLLDQLRIARLEQDWGLWRDTGRWDALRAAYAPGATMTTTWSHGPATAFVDACERAFGKGPLVQHVMGACTVEIAGSRAVSEIRVALLVRDRLDDVEIDITCYCRFVDRLVLQGGRWLILGRTPIYEKDMVVPVDPSRTPMFDAALLSEYPAGYRHLAYMQARGGAAITRNLPAPNSPEQAALYEAGRAWLGGAG